MPFIGLSRPRTHQPHVRMLSVGSPAPMDDEAFSIAGNVVNGAAARVSLVAFLRHTGCPFAEHTVKVLRRWAQAHPDVAVHVVSHGAPDVTEAWLREIGGAAGLHHVADPARALYARWGLGYSGFWHFAGPASLMGVVALWFKGIRNRSASGTRWQRAGVFLVRDGRVAWMHVPGSAEGFELPPLGV